MYAEVDERGMGHFRWKEQDESAVDSVKLLLQQTLIRADFWKDK